jgi:hypothetical protein
VLVDVSDLNSNENLSIDDDLYPSELTSELIIKDEIESDEAEEFEHSDNFMHGE